MRGKIALFFRINRAKIYVCKIKTTVIMAAESNSIASIVRTRQHQ